MIGCSGNYGSIFRTFNVDNGESVVTDAKQRIVTNVDVNKTSSFLGRINPSRIVCAEPSPDVAQVVSSAFEASISAAKESEGSNAGALGSIDIHDSH